MRILALAALIVVYAAAVIAGGAYTFINPPSDRLLAPLFVPLVILIGVALYRLVYRKS